MDLPDSNTILVGLFGMFFLVFGIFNWFHPFVASIGTKLLVDPGDLDGIRLTLSRILSVMMP